MANYSEYPQNALINNNINHYNEKEIARHKIVINSNSKLEKIIQFSEIEVNSFA